jgi:hypothetical protein
MVHGDKTNILIAQFVELFYTQNAPISVMTVEQQYAPIMHTPPAQEPIVVCVLMTTMMKHIIARTAIVTVAQQTKKTQ